MQHPHCNDRLPNPTAAVVVVPKNGRILAIRSYKRGGLVGFPGGKIEKGETPAAAAMRELLEETGIHARALLHIGQRADGDGDHVVALFLAVQFTGRPKSSREGITFWGTPEDLMGKTSAFPTFNTWAIERARGAWNGI